MNTERREVTRAAAQHSLETLDSLAEVIADAVEAALDWQPEEAPPYMPVPAPMRWSCGCAVRDCNLRLDQWQDSSSDPSVTIKVICITHSLVGRSHPGLLREGLDRLNAQAMLNLDLAHQEQCR